MTPRVVAAYLGGDLDTVADAPAADATPTEIEARAEQVQP